MPRIHAHTSFRASYKPVWRLIACCVIVLGNFLLPIAAVGEENVQLLPTIQTCKDPALSFADVSAAMVSYGWQAVTSDEHKRDAARHISIGVHYNPNSNWNEEARKMTLDLPKRLRSSKFSSSMGTEFRGTQLFLRDASGAQYLLLKENVEHGPEGTFRAKARKCLIVTRPNNETKSIESQGVKRANWIELPQSITEYSGQSYSVDIRLKKLTPQKHYLKATEFIQIDVGS